MKNSTIALLGFLSLYALIGPTVRAQEKQRVVILTDMTHDDGNSLIRYLYYSHYFDTEAIIVTPQLPDYTHDATGPWDKVQGILSAYQQEYPQLSKHEPSLPSYEQIAEVTKQGRGALPIIWLTNTGKFSGRIADRTVETTWGNMQFHDWIGEGLTPNGAPKDSEGSEFLQEVFAKDDDRPIFVQAWGGPVTFIQALYRYRERQGAEKYGALLKKLHVFGILLQDITFDFLVNLDKIQAQACANMGDVTATFEGERSEVGWLLHDAGHFWKYLKAVDRKQVNGHGALSAIYDGGGEGDTPAFLYLLSNHLGLNDPLDPTQGSWGSRFVKMGDAFPDGYYHTCQLPDEELMRWTPQASNSFMNRLLWSVKEPGEVNREPVAVLNGDESNQIIYRKVKPGKILKFDAAASYDPDGDSLRFNWYVYPAAGTYQGELSIPDPKAAKQNISVPKDLGNTSLHLILEVHDSGSPSLVRYRRVIIEGK